MLGVHLLHFNYELLQQLVGGVPIGVLYGDVQTGKSTAMEAALSLLGTQESHYRKRCSDVRFLRITSQTTLGLVLDDLTQAHGLVEKIMVLFDGKAVESGGETFRPRTMQFHDSAQHELLQILGETSQVQILSYCYI